MKRFKRLTVALLALLLALQIMPVSALNEDDPYDEETDVYVPSDRTTVPDVTLPIATLPTSTTAPSPTTTEPAETPAPLVHISRRDMTTKPAVGETFSVTVQFRNYSTISLLQGLAVFEPGEGLVLAEKTDTKVVPVIDPHGIARIELKLRVAKDNAVSDVPVQVSYAYSYRTPQGIVSATASEKLMLTVGVASSAEKSENAASATPNIIVTQYNYGGTIAAGDAFTLRLSFTNTSRKLPAENIVMSVETGDGVTITGASNTYYYASLGAGKTATQNIPMRVLTTADAMGGRVEIAFRYEYVDNGTRGSASANESLSIPIYVPDRFTLIAPDAEVIGMQNEELPISVSYINKGRSEVSNVHARLVYDAETAYCEQPQLNLGNFEPGKSGTIDFYLTPSEEGAGEVQVVVTYEDVLTEEKTVTVRVPYSVDPSYAEEFTDSIDDFPTEEDAKTSPVKWILLIGIPVLVIVLIVVLVSVRRKRKKKAGEIPADFDWNITQETQEQTDENR